MYEDIRFINLIYNVNDTKQKALSSNFGLRGTNMKTKLQKLILILTIISCVCQISIDPTKGKQEQKELLTYKGAHYPSGYQGFTNQFYYWWYGYGPAASYGKPSIYDINTGKLLFLSKYDWYYLNVYGRFLVLKDALVPESFVEYGKTYVYCGAKLILILKEELLYINDQNWFSQGKNELSIYSTKTNKKVGSFPLKAGQICVLVNNKNNPGFAVIDKTAKTTEIVSFKGLKTLLNLPFALFPSELERETIRKIGKGLLYELDLVNYKITRMLKTPLKGDDLELITPERAFDWNKKTLIDVLTGRIILTVNGNLSFKEVAIGGKIIFCNYEGTDLRCYFLKDGKLIWQYQDKGKGFGDLFSYGERILGNLEENGKFVCLDLNTGKTKWQNTIFRLSYFRSHFNGNLAFDCQHIKEYSGNQIFNCVNLDNGNILWSRVLGEKEVSEVDFEKGRYYIQEDYSTVKCFDLKTHKRIW